MASARFARSVVLTLHARRRMLERDVPEAMVLDVVETGTAKWKDATHGWLFTTVPGRQDNLICVVVVLEQVVVVKTVMHHFVEEAP